MWNRNSQPTWQYFNHNSWVQNPDSYINPMSRSVPAIIYHSHRRIVAFSRWRRQLFLPKCPSPRRCLVTVDKSWGSMGWKSQGSTLCCETRRSGFHSQFRRLDNITSWERLAWRRNFFPYPVLPSTHATHATVGDPWHLRALAPITWASNSLPDCLLATHER